MLKSSNWPNSALNTGFPVISSMQFQDSTYTLPEFRQEMDSHSSNPDMQRAIVDINENRNERQKCVLLCALGRHLREISRALIADTKRLRDEGTALRKESGERQRN